jgi:hypothetical protein
VTVLPADPPAGPSVARPPATPAAGRAGKAAARNALTDPPGAALPQAGTAPTQRGRPARAATAVPGPAATPADVPARRPVEPEPDANRATRGYSQFGIGGYGEYGDPSAGQRRRDPAERGLRGLVAAGPSQVGVTGAMRARDAARPRPEDLEAAERDLVIVRRYYVPPDGPPVPAAPPPATDEPD